jgi:hypothetical protein
MKKMIAAIMTLTLMAAFAVPTFAQGYGHGRTNTTQSRQYNQYNRNNYSNQRYDIQRRNDRSFWDKHRDKLTLGAGTVGGALLGAIIGGRKGAAIGALAGAGGSALYTYKLRDKHRRRY